MPVPNNNPVNGNEQDNTENFDDMNARINSLVISVESLGRSVESLIKSMPPEQQADLQHSQDTVQLHERIALLQNNVDDIQQNQGLIAGALQDLKDSLDAYNAVLLSGTPPQPANPGTPKAPANSNPGTKGQPNSDNKTGQPNSDQDSNPSDKTPHSPDVNVDAGGDQAYVTTLQRRGRRRVMVKKPVKPATARKWYDKQPHELFTGKRTMSPPPSSSQGGKGK